MRNTKRLLVILIASISLTLLADGGGQASAAEEGTLRLEKYGMELTLPSRWSLITKEGTPEKAQYNFKRIGIASDVKGYADVVIFARAGANITLTKEVTEEIYERVAARISKVIPKYKFKQYGYSSRKKAEKQLKIGSGETVTVEYSTLSFRGNINKEIILAHFSHKDNFFCVTIFNTSVEADIEKLAEEEILPGVKLF